MSDDYGYGEDADGIQRIPPYGPVTRLDVLVRCNLCGALIEGDVGGQSIHDAWHRTLDDRILRASSVFLQRYMLAPEPPVVTP